MKLFNVSAAVGWHMGNRRKNNEDNFYFNGEYVKDLNRKDSIFLKKVNSDKLQIYAVCDGMGGEELGEVASYIAVETLEKYHKRFFTCCDESNIEKYIDDYIYEANDKICKKIIELRKNRMGTTLALVIVFGEKIYITNLGDSKIYIFANNELIQISKDHTQAQMLIESGITDVKDFNHAKNVLTQHLGISKEDRILQPAKACFKLKRGDKFLISSDGLTDMVSDLEIENIVKDNCDEKDIVNKLVEKALLNGGKDNITVILISISKNNSKKHNKRYMILATFLILAIIGGLFVVKNSFHNKEVFKQNLVDKEKILQNEKEELDRSNKIIYSDYIKDELVKKYGNSKLINDDLAYEYNKKSIPLFGTNILVRNINGQTADSIYKDERQGIISIAFCDLNGDSTKEMLVVRGESYNEEDVIKNTVDNTFIQVYTIKNGKVCLLGEEIQVGDSINPNVYYDRQDTNIFIKKYNQKNYICTLIYEKSDELKASYKLNIYEALEDTIELADKFELSLSSLEESEDIENNIIFKQNDNVLNQNINETLGKYGFTLDVFNDYENNLLKSDNSSGLYPAGQNNKDCDDICIFKLFCYDVGEYIKLNFQYHDFTNRNCLFE